MSDTSTAGDPGTIERDGGALFSGPDGRLSLRRISAAVLMAWGAGLLTWGMTMGAQPILARLLPGGILILAGIFLLGLITAQNLKEIAEAVKG